MAGILRDLWTWDAYGAASSLPSFANWNVLYPGAWSTIAITNPPWLPINGTGYALKFNGPSAPATTTNPGAGVYSIPVWAGMQGVILGFWLYIVTMPSSGIALMRVNDSRGSQGSQVPPQGLDHSYLALSSAGVITAYDAANTSAGTYTGLSTGTWYFVEYYAFIGDTSGGTSKQGSVQLSINGTAQITNTNAQTRFTGQPSYHVDNFTLDGEFDQTAVYYFGPGYWMDATSSAAAGMLGKQYFQTFFPTAISGSTVFTPSTGGNVAAISSAPPGSPYIYAATQADVERYTVGTVDISNINAVQTQLLAAQSARGGRMVSPVLKSGTTTLVMRGMGTKGGANTAGGSYADSTGYFIKRALTVTDPNTSAAWTQAAATAATVGEEVFQ